MKKRIIESLNYIQKYVHNSPNIKSKEVRKIISGEVMNNIELVKRYIYLVDEDELTVSFNLDNEKEKILFDIVSIAKEM